MKIADAIVRIKALRKEHDDVDIVTFSQGNEVVKPMSLVEAIDRKAVLLSEISRLKSLIAKTNVQTVIQFNGASLTLSQALNTLDALREQKRFLESSILRSIKGAVPSRPARVGNEYVDVPFVANFTQEDAFDIRNAATKLDADIQTLSSVINYTNWNTDLVT